MHKLLYKKAKGQGVVEYAGALVVAAALVAAVLLIGPDAIQGMFQNIIDTITQFLEAQLDAAVGGGGGGDAG
ncbi:MAG: Flp family type IVb pilin [Candidatus Melainabacteria bacterium]|nr:Flp family type IVb pilin [Candidatus Melainabacteria bacterium]